MIARKITASKSDLSTLKTSVNKHDDRSSTSLRHTIRYVRIDGIVSYTTYSHRAMVNIGVKMSGGCAPVLKKGSGVVTCVQMNAREQRSCLSKRLNG